MTNEQFALEYGRLLEWDKASFQSPARQKLIARYVQPLEHSWWRKTVDQIILSNNRFFDIAEAARGERRAITSLRVARDESEAYSAFSRAMSERGLEETLEKMGSNSLWDAVRKGGPQ